MGYQYNFLLKLPVYECYREGKVLVPGSVEYQTMCKPSYFCQKNDVEYSVVKDDSLSLNNWIEDFDLTCESNLVISFFSMCYIIGILLGFMLLPFFQDRYGRKKVFCTAIFVTSLILLGDTILPRKNSSKWVIYILDIIFGMMSSCRFSTGYNYVVELWPSKNLSVSGSLIHFLEGIIIIVIACFYMFVSKNWRPLFLYGAISGFAFLALNIFLIPDSPKWLYS